MRGERLEKLLPLAIFCVVALIGLVILPSALRPPNQQPNQTAALSPDAPPDDDPQALIASLNRGASGVGGLGPAANAPGKNGTGAAPAPDSTVQPAPATTLVPRSCPHGVGTPPRQVESIYSASCAGPFLGNNGGATYRGVTSNEIRIAVRSTGNRGSGNNCDTNGRIADKDASIRNPAERTFFAFQEYFNRNFQLYGRQLSFYCVQPEGSSIDQERAAAILAADTYGVYGSLFSSTVECDEFTRRKMVSMCEGLTDREYAAADPYEWASYESGSDNALAVAEYVCKKLAGKPAAHAGDTSYLNATRKFGLITYGNRGFGELADVARDALKACGVDLEVILTTPAADDAANGEAQLAAAITTFKNDHVTTVIPVLDIVAMSVFSYAASSQKYGPEWVASDAGAIVNNQLAGVFIDQSQWAHAFGLTLETAQKPLPATECVRAYRTIDPANSPNETICDYEWRAMMLYVSAIQEAGPNLNPQTQKQGFYKLSHYWNSPAWPAGGGYRPGKYGYNGDITEVYWDVTATDPVGRVVGAYRYIDNGKRYCPGQLTKDFKAFDSTNAPSLVPDYNQPAISYKPSCLDAHPSGR